MRSHPGIAARDVRDARAARDRAGDRLDLADQDRLLRARSTTSSARSAPCTTRSSSSGRSAERAHAATAHRRRRRDRRRRRRHCAGSCWPSAASRTCASSPRRARPACEPFGDGELGRGGHARGARRAGELDVFLFASARSASRELVPHAVRGSAIAIDKSSAYRIDRRRAARRPRGERRARARARRDRRHPELLRPSRSPASSSRCTTRRASRRVRVATYQSVSGAGCGAWRLFARRASGGERPPHGLGLRRRGVGRGGEAPLGDAQDPRASGAARERDLRARPGARRTLRGDLDRVRGAALGRAGARAARRGARLRLDDFPSPGRRPGWTRSWWGASGATVRRRERPGAVPLGRQPAQGRRAERDSDRRAAARRQALAA